MLFSLLVHLLSGNSGQVLINGKNINLYDKDSLKSIFGVVLITVSFINSIIGYLMERLNS